MRISFERSGGIAGLPGQSLELDTEKMSDDKRRELEQLIEAIGPLDGLKNAKSSNQARDAFQYDLTIDDGTTKQSISVSDGAIPDKLQPLIRFLTKELNATIKKRMKDK